MKTQFLVVVALVLGIKGFSQETITVSDSLEQEAGNAILYTGEVVVPSDSTRYFSFSPISRRVGAVNGLVLGVGHFENHRIACQKVNGLNLEITPMAAIVNVVAFNLPIELLVAGIYEGPNAKLFFDSPDRTYIRVDGVNLSTGGFMGGAQCRGVNMSVLTFMNEMKGVSFSLEAFGAITFSGVSISGLGNTCEYGKGVQIAVSNLSRNHKGVQIGLFNNSKNLRGMQFGLWNTNGKRKLPFINWQFKEAVKKSKA